eukprot:gene43466-biopygen29682
MNTLAYTPYDSKVRPFTIGLTSLDPERWIEPDAGLAAFLVEKDRLGRAHSEDIFYEESGPRAAQQECLDLLVDHLLTRHAGIYRREHERLQFAGRALDLAQPGMPPLLKAGGLVQDDLVILERRATGWHLTAG